eukprot:2280924-Rhodomonas_salina.3
MDAESRMMMMVMLEDSMWLDRYQQKALREADTLKMPPPCHRNRVEPVVEDGSCAQHQNMSSHANDSSAEQRTGSNDSLQFNIANMHLGDSADAGSFNTGPLRAHQASPQFLHAQRADSSGHCYSPEGMVSEGTRHVHMPAPEFVSPQGVSCIASETFNMVQRSGFGGFSRCSSAGPVLYTDNWAAGGQPQIQAESHDEFMRRCQSHE